MRQIVLSGLYVAMMEIHVLYPYGKREKYTCPILFKYIRFKIQKIKNKCSGFSAGFPFNVKFTSSREI